MAVTSAEEFFAVLEKSNLLIPAQLAQARSAAGQSDSPRTIAKSLAHQNLISRWQAGQLLAGRSTFYLGKYRLIELLGRGGMGSVFLGQHVTMNRRVALKIISRHVGKDPVSLERFLAEARAIASLDHPNIVRAYSVDSEGDRYYIVMEYVEGVDLQRLVENGGPLDCHRAVDYIHQAADGLDHAHQRNMVHCDIKPSNLLVNMRGVVKILDLGLARLTGGDESDAASQDERVLGSVDYLAPEQALKSPHLDCRADIYALGCTLYFLLTGHPPFPQGTLPERILKHQTQAPPDLRAEQPTVPADLAAICKKMMAKKPEDRYQTAADVSRVLAEVRASTPPLKRATPLPMAKRLEEP
jgi:eukaryotic-like serine/threonine-protein kinase